MAGDQSTSEINRGSTLRRLSLHNRSVKSVVLLLFTFHFSLFTCFAQDRPPATPPPLPFQQPAEETNDEQLGMQFFQTRDYEKAVEVYARIYDKKPSYYIYTYYLTCLVETRDYEKAEKLIKNMRKSDPDALKFSVDMGYLYFREGNPDKARKQYEDALNKLQPNQQQIFDLANAFTIRGENDYAVKTYIKGRELLNYSYTFSFELASIYERTGNFKEMINEYFILLEFNKSYLATVQDRLQTVLADDPENIKNDAFRKAVLEKAQKEPDKTFYAEILWWYSVQQKDFELALIQAKSLDRRLQEDGGRVYQLAQLAVSNQQFDAAIDAYKYLIAKGSGNPFYYNSKMDLLNTRLLKVISIPNPDREQLTELEKELKDELKISGVNSRSISVSKSLAHLDAFYLGKSDDAIELLNQLMELPDINPQAKAECKLELADILLFSNDVWEATLLYEQVNKDFKNDVIGQAAKFKNAKLSYYIGEFGWAEDQLDILKAATSKLIANDALALALFISENYDADSNTVALGLYSRADLLEFRNENDLALKTLDSIFMAFAFHPILDDVLLKKAEIKMKQGDYAAADTLLATLIKDFPSDVLADLALMERGQLNEDHFGNKEKAMQYYEELITEYPGSIYAVDARKRFRNLRGDKGF
jgi:pentatricopeptide repeat protein